MNTTDVVIIGGGQAGLAMSRCLQDHAIDHVILERGRVAERWRTERWDSLRLLTPNWQTRLPGFRYDGPDPDGYMTVPEVVGFLDDYARSFSAPVVTDARVESVTPTAGGYLVQTPRSAWRAPHVVLATGHSDRPAVPRAALGLSGNIQQITPSRYRTPSQLEPGGVLVVGAAASGVQLAEEIHASGRPVTLAVGRHTRLPRRYRGRDILWWLDQMGVFDDSIGQVFDAEVSRQQPSLQLVGRPDRRSLGLSELHAQGVRLVGRIVGAERSTVFVDDSLPATTAAADVKLASLLRRVDAFIEAAEGSVEVDDPEPFQPTWPLGLSASASAIDLPAEGIRTILWATGFRRAYPWLHVPVLDTRGDILHSGGVTPAEGLYVLGYHFQRRRKSAFIDGVGDDARELAGLIARRLWRRPTAA